MGAGLPFLGIGAGGDRSNRGRVARHDERSQHVFLSEREHRAQ